MTMKTDIRQESKLWKRTKINSKCKQLIMISKFKSLKTKMIQKIRKYLICKIILYSLKNRILNKNYR
jgi:hypothetical protein